MQHLRKGAVNLIGLTTMDVHIVDFQALVAAAAVHLLLALPRDDEALRKILPDLAEAQQHPDVSPRQDDAVHTPAPSASAGHPGASSLPSVRITLTLPLTSQLVEPAAAVLALCGSVRPAPVAMFRSALLTPHWVERHMAMESLATYTRAVVDDSDLRSVVPAELQAQGTPPH